MPSKPITRARANKFKNTLNEAVQNIWIKMDLKELGVSKKHVGQSLIYLSQNQEEPNPSHNGG